MNARRSFKQRRSTQKNIIILILLTLFTGTTLCLYQSALSLPLKTQLPTLNCKPTAAQSLPTATPGPLSSQQQHLLQRRWSGYTTVTIFVNTVTVNLASAPVVTVTVNPSDPNASTGIVTVTAGSYTQTITQSGVWSNLPASTQTVYITGSPPTTTIRTTSVVTYNGGPTSTTSTIYTGTPTSSSTPWLGGSGPQDGLPADRPCYPGEESQRVPGNLKPTHPTQTSTLFAIALYFVVGIVSWNLVIVRNIIFPAKLVVVSWHELGHVVGASCSGCKVASVTIDPNEGGATRMDFPPPNPLSHFLGYVSSCLIGGLLVFCGFNTLASKIASFFVMISLVVSFWWSTYISRLWSLCVLGFSIGLWFIDHAGVLRYYVLFFGVLSSWYVIFDVADDFVFRKMNPCCPALFFLRYPKISAGQWGIIWMFYSAVSFIGWILLALTVWRQTPRAMFCQSQQFLPT